MPKFSYLVRKSQVARLLPHLGSLFPDAKIQEVPCKGPAADMYSRLESQGDLSESLAIAVRYFVMGWTVRDLAK